VLTSLFFWNTYCEETRGERAKSWSEVYCFWSAKPRSHSLGFSTVLESRENSGNVWEQLNWPMVDFVFVWYSKSGHATFWPSISEQGGKKDMRRLLIPFECNRFQMEIRKGVVVSWKPEPAVSAETCIMTSNRACPSVSIETNICDPWEAENALLEHLNTSRSVHGLLPWLSEREEQKTGGTDGTDFWVYVSVDVWKDSGEGWQCLYKLSKARHYVIVRFRTMAFGAQYHWSALCKPRGTLTGVLVFLSVSSKEHLRLRFSFERNRRRANEHDDG
jgi:hypothetical protein